MLRVVVGDGPRHLGDAVPKSHGARVVAVALSFMGLILVGIVVAVAVHALGLALQATRGA